MNPRLLFLSLTAVSIMGVVCLPSARAQAPQSDSDQAPSGPAATMPGGREASRRGSEGRGRGVFGKISALQADSVEITGQDGTKVSIKLTSGTEFRKDRQPANRSDFKVGDTVVVRTGQDSGGASGATALMVAAAPAGGFAGRGGSGGGQGMMQGTMGKDYVVGEVKNVAAPKLTILRVDSATQTLELNEETSLRRGRDSVTMADIQPGDHIFARGAVANDVFVPKSVMVIPPEQWKRMQEMMNEGGGTRGAAPQNPPAPPAPPAPSTAPTPPEQHN
jgi:hypothetical protein